MVNMVWNRERINRLISYYGLLVYNNEHILVLYNISDGSDVGHDDHSFLGFIGIHELWCITIVNVF